MEANTLDLYITNKYGSIAAAAAAISAAGGGTLYLSEGTFSVSGNLQLPPNVSLVGAGRGRTKIVSSNLNDSILSAYQPNVTVRGLSIAYTSKPSRVSYPGNCGIDIKNKGISLIDVDISLCTVGVIFDGAEDCIMVGCYVHDTSADGVACFGYTAPNKRVRIIGNTMWNTEDDAISCNTYTANGIAQNEECIIANNNIKDGGAAGIAVWGAKNVTVEGNTVKNTFLAGIKVLCATGFASTDGAKIIGNTVVNAGQKATGGIAEGGTVSGTLAGILVHAQNGNISNVSISNNTIRDPQGNYIAIYGAGGLNNINVRDNDCLDGNDLVASVSGKNSSGSNAGIYIADAAKVRVSGNDVFSARADGIYVENTCSGRVQIMDNYVEDCNQGAVAGANAITVKAGRLTAIGNDIHDPNSRITNAFALAAALSGPICTNTMNQVGGRAIATI